MLICKHIRKEKQQPNLQSLDTKKQRAKNQSKESCMFIQQTDKAVYNKTLLFVFPWAVND